MYLSERHNSGWGVRRRAKFRAAISVCAALTLAGCGKLSEMTDESNGAIAACEKRVIGSLPVASNYNRLAAAYLLGSEISRSDHVAFEETSGCPLTPAAFNGEAACLDGKRYIWAFMAAEELKKRGVNHPTQRQRNQARRELIEASFDPLQLRPPQQRKTAFVTLDYQITNSSGKAQRQEYICQFGPRSGDKHTEYEIFNPLGDVEYHGG